ncbi:MAG: T9SS type A sorting domain-containing protein [Bacteroidota bacterium]
MKKYLCVILIAVGSFSYAEAQFKISAKTTKIERVVQAELEGVLAAYEVLSLPTQEIVNWAQEVQREANLKIEIAERNYTIIAEPNALVAPNFRAVLVNEKGEEQIVNDQLVLKSFRGYLEGEPGTEVRFSVTNIGLDMTMSGPRFNTRLTPIRSFGHNQAGEDIYILYDETALIGASECRMPDNLPELVPSPNLRPEDGLTPNGGGSRSITTCAATPYSPRSFTPLLDCILLQIAADADNEMVNFFGGGLFGAFGTFATVFNTIDAAEPAYEANFDMSFQITQLRVFLPGFDVDPYPNGINLATEANSLMLINSIDNLWAGISQANVPRDITILYTGLECLGPNDNGDLVASLGRADGFGTVCVDDAAAFITSCAFTAGSQNITTAHEIGHTFNAFHPNANFFNPCSANPCNLGPGGNSLMCLGDCDAGDINFIDPANVNTMLTHIANHGTCLFETDLGEIFGPALLCKGQSGTYTISFHHVAGASFFGLPAHAWSVGPGLQIDNQNPFQVTITATTQSAYISWIEINLAGVDNCNARIRKPIILNAKPVFCSSYEICKEDIPITLSGDLYTGSSMSNLQCLNNCNNISYSSVLGGSPSINISSAQVGIYTFSYNVSSICGNFPFLFSISVIDDCKDPKGNSPKREGVSSASPLELFPNPANENVQLTYTSPSAATHTIKVLDAQGKVVLQQSVDTNAEEKVSVKLKLNALAAGVYLVQVQAGVHSWTEKLIKQ